MRTLIILAALVGLGACTTSTAHQTAQNSMSESSHDCFLASSAHGYTIVDDHTVGVDVGPGRHYLLATSWNAHDLDWSQVIALRTTGSDWICTGNGLGVEVRGGNPPQTYPITSITRAPDHPPAAHGS